MDGDARNRMQVVIYYAAWAIVCSAAAGLLIALIHTCCFSYSPNRSGLIDTLFGDAGTALAIAAGQGAVALVTGSVLAHYGRALERTVLLGLLLGLFDVVMYFVQMAVPLTEFGWIPDIAILVCVTVFITLYGTAPRSAV